ncbi:MAG: putative carboxypeptidase [Ignavibacteria bacterium]|nr:MAG: putative carboxypeptidase [Ignavibacteria bacterium]KAF0160066.1 MAG: putative carboxypeptidase [Ignavibacteria bacterium]
MKKELLNNLFESYHNYTAYDIRSDFIKHNEVKVKLENLAGNNLFEIKQIGTSVERREIYSLKLGKGKTKIFVWTQMHGDEPTATAAFFDLLNFFSSNDSFNELRKSILDNLEVHFVPMVNPDGAERYQRENAFNIDLNRDALRLEADESKLLWNYAEKLKPEFGFNMHDQNSYYTAGRTNNPASISLLTPPMDYVKSINYTREKSMQIIIKIREALEQFIPNQIARYSDDFELRAFGDNFTRFGISTILIESGFYRDDYNKDFVRKLNFTALISAFESIVESDYQKKFYAEYFAIPENNKLLFDLLLRNLTLEFNHRKFVVDIGINITKKLNRGKNEFYHEACIADIGDLSIFYGINEMNMNGYTIENHNELKIDEPANFKIAQNGITKYEIINGLLKSL